ncbi:hypothetical protein P0F12_002323 [Vibrio metschnikovii]|nr:hypothetical protein [Vibrio metschnikovii]EKO3746256.1 hypothetical protein [Vibrio metschnikovii]
MGKLRCILFKVLVVTMLLDPTNTVLGIKLPLFCLFLILSVRCFNYSTIKALPIFLYYIAIVAGSTSLFLQSTSYDPTFLANYFTTGGVLLLLPLLNKDYFKYLTDAFLFACFLISLFTIGFFIFFKVNGVSLIYEFDFKNTFIVTPRSYVGIPFLMVYHKSVCALLVAVGIVFNRMVNDKVNLVSIFLITIFVFALFISATRANMLAALSLIVAFCFFLCNKNRYYVLSVVISMLGVFFVFSALIITLNFATDDSNSIKYGHMISIYEYLSDNLIYLFFGMGAGSLYYSSGFGAVVPITEVTYFEFVRSFGMLISPLLFFMFLFPIFYSVFKKMSDQKMFFTSYFVFLVVGGTNPLLIGNLGFLILILSYSVLVFQTYD